MLHLLAQDTIFAYLTCGNYDFRCKPSQESNTNLVHTVQHLTDHSVCIADDIQKGLRPRRSVRTAMAHEM
jgi:hypothetical protein